MKRPLESDDPEYYDGLPTRPSDQEPSGGWDSTLLYTGLGGLVLMLIVGVALWAQLTRPAVQVPSMEPLEAVIVFLLLCAVGIWVLVLLVATLIWMIWQRIPSAKSDAADPKLRERG